MLKIKNMQSSAVEERKEKIQKKQVELMSRADTTKKLSRQSQSLSLSEASENILKPAARLLVNSPSV